MYKIRLLFAGIFLALMFQNSVSANCIDYFKGKQYLEIEARKLVVEYGGTLIALVGCQGACSDDPNPEVCAVLACGLTCLVVGPENCFNFFNKAFALQRYQKRLETLNNGCE